MLTTAYDQPGTLGMLEGTLGATALPPDPVAGPTLTYCFCGCFAVPDPESGGPEA